MFPVEKIEIVPERPALKDVMSAARYWDKAGTEDGGAYSAGVLMLRMRDGTYVIVDVRRGQWSALDRERVIKQTASTGQSDLRDDKNLHEQEPGSGGKESAEASRWYVRGLRVEADRVSGAKEVRADPFAAQWQAGNVGLLPRRGIARTLTSTSSFHRRQVHRTKSTLRPVRSIRSPVSIATIRLSLGYRDESSRWPACPPSALTLVLAFKPDGCVGSPCWGI